MEPGAGQHIRIIKTMVERERGDTDKARMVGTARMQRMRVEDKARVRMDMEEARMGMADANLEGTTTRMEGRPRMANQRGMMGIIRVVVVMGMEVGMDMVQTRMNGTRRRGLVRGVDGGGLEDKGKGGLLYGYDFMTCGLGLLVRFAVGRVWT